MSDPATKVTIVNGVRTPIGRFGGTLSSVRPDVRWRGRNVRL